MAKLDVEHFFMSGTSTELAKGAAAIIREESLSNCIKECVFFLAENQFIKVNNSEARSQTTPRRHKRHTFKTAEAQMEAPTSNM